MGLSNNGIQNISEASGTLWFCINAAFGELPGKGSQGFKQESWWGLGACTPGTSAEIPFHSWGCSEAMSTTELPQDIPRQGLCYPAVAAPWCGHSPGTDRGLQGQTDPLNLLPLLPQTQPLGIPETQTGRD